MQSFCSSTVPEGEVGYGLRHEEAFLLLSILIGQPMQTKAPFKGFPISAVDDLAPGLKVYVSLHEMSLGFLLSGI